MRIRGKDKLGLIKHLLVKDIDKIQKCLDNQNLVNKDHGVLKLKSAAKGFSEKKESKLENDDNEAEAEKKNTSLLNLKFSIQQVKWFHNRQKKNNGFGDNQARNCINEKFKNCKYKILDQKDIFKDIDKQNVVIVEKFPDSDHRVNFVDKDGYDYTFGNSLNSFNKKGQ